MSSRAHGKQGVWRQLQACPSWECNTSYYSNFNLLKKSWYEELMTVTSEIKAMRQNNVGLKKFPSARSYSYQTTGIPMGWMGNCPKFPRLEIQGWPLLIMLMQVKLLPKSSGKLWRPEVKNPTEAQRSQQGNLIADIDDCEYGGCKQHRWREGWGCVGTRDTEFFFLVGTRCCYSRQQRTDIFLNLTVIPSLCSNLFLRTAKILISSSFLVYLMFSFITSTTIL